MIKILSQSDEVCKAGIYKITCLVNEKVYIGSAVDLDRRYQEHFFSLKNKTHCNPHLQNTWNKYGSENFTFDVIQYVSHVKRLLFWEQLYLDYYHAAKRAHGFNICSKAGSCLGIKRSAKFCTEISDRMKGNQYGKGTKRLAETCVKMTAIQVKNNLFYWVATSPNGVVYDLVLNISEFCRDHSLNQGNMCAVASGKRKQHKGWLCQKVNKIDHE